MSLKAEIETWANALDSYDAQDFNTALASFESISDSSKILVNIGLIYATIGEHEKAIESFRAATRLDRYLAVAYFQCGVSNFLLGRFEGAVADFDSAYLYLRGNLTIDYNQLGLKFRLYSCEVLFNKGLALIYMGREERGMVDLAEARREKQTSEHNVIDEALSARGDNYTVFSIPVGVVYRPSANKLKNLRTKNYLGTAKLVATTDVAESFTGFTGVERAQRSDSVKSDRGFVSEREKQPSLVRRGTAAARLEGTTLPTSSGPKKVPQPLALDNASNPLSTAPPAELALRRLPYRSDSRRDPYSLSSIIDSPERELNGTFGQQNFLPTPPSRSPSEYTQTSLSKSRPAVTGAERGRNEGSQLPGMPVGGLNRALSVRSTAGCINMEKIRVKLHRSDETRGMSIGSETSLQDLRSKIAKKLDLVGVWGMEYLDEDQVMVRIVDDDDWAVACDAARDFGRDNEGKLDIWILV